MSFDERRTSKFLSYVLRHRPDAIGIELDEHGWVDIAALIDAANAAGTPITREGVDRAVRNNDKQRFRISDDGARIRANQGHSVGIELNLPEQTPPNPLYHGTAETCLDSILASGLQKRQRQHVHLSAEIATARNVGIRHGRPVVLVVDTEAMLASGHVFYRSDNGVWLTDHVPSECLRRLPAN